MLTRIFGQITSATSIFVGAYILLLGGIHFFVQKPLSSEIETAYGPIQLNQWLAYLLCVSLIVVLVYGYQALLFGKYHLLKHHAYVPFFLLPLVLMFLGVGRLNFLLESAIFLAVLSLWLKAYQGDNMLSLSLNTGLLLGLGSVLNHGYVWFLVLGFVVYIIYGRFSFRTFLIPIIGYLTIWLNLVGLEFLLADTTVFFEAFLEHFQIQVHQLKVNSYWQYLPLLVLFLLGLIELIKTIGRASVFKKQSYIIMLLALVVAIAVLFLYGSQALPGAIVLPMVVVLFANFIQYVKRTWLVELMLWLMLVTFGIFESGLL